MYKSIQSTKIPIALTFSEHILTPNLRLGQGNSDVSMIYHLDSGEDKASAPNRAPERPLILSRNYRNAELTDFSLFVVAEPTISSAKEEAEQNKDDPDNAKDNSESPA